MMRGKAITAALAILLLPPPTGAEGHKSFKKKSFQKSYRQVLVRYAAGDFAGAAGALVAQESAALDQHGVKVLNRMHKAEVGVLKDLIARGRFDVLIPVILLHEESYVSYLDQGNAPLARHSRTLAADLVQVYSVQVKGEEGRFVASGLMASLAGYFQDAYLDSAAAELFALALEVDSHNLAALQGLAGIYERHGQYEQTVFYLEQLTRIDPLDREGRLRLAVNLRRVGREREAGEKLRQLVRGPENDWILSLAYQELARILTDNGDHISAKMLLEESVQRLPSDPSIPIQLAYLSERDDEVEEDTDLLGSLRRCAAEGMESPRYLYSQTPAGALADLRRVLSRERNERLSLLAAALEGRRRPWSREEAGS